MHNQKLWDITPLVTADYPLWPGSQALVRKLEFDLLRGDPVTSSSFSASAHLGAHADAPSHYAKEGESIEQCSLKYYLGLCQVIKPQVEKNGVISQEMITTKITAPRLLFSTSTFNHNKPFENDFASFDPECFEWLARQDVMTIGIDVPSIDLFRNEDLPCHHLAYQYGIAILENLDLRDITEGLYEMIALPLKLHGFDASPVRAVLRSLPGNP